MDRTSVAAFYRGKGYQVHESIVVTGQSGNQQRVPLLCEGPLGNLAVFFGDAAGIDGPEIGAAKRVARDLGATAVVAAGSFTGEQRAQAAELGVVLLEASAMAPPAARPTAGIESAWPGQTPRQNLERDLAAHPWPASGRQDSLAAARAAAFADIDDVAAPRPAPAAMPSAAAKPTAEVAAPPRTVTPATRGDGGGLWKHTHAPAPASASSTATGKPAAKGGFAWLDLPKPEPEAAEVEVDATVTARAAPKPPTAEELRAREMAKWEREDRLRTYARRLGLAAAIIGVVWLFLIWWF